MKTRKIIIILMLAFVILSLGKKGCTALTHITFDKALVKTQDYIFDKAAGAHSTVKVSIDTLNAYFSDSMTDRVVICLNTRGRDSSYYHFIDGLGEADHLLVITNFEDKCSCQQLEERFADTGIDFLNLKAWPLMGLTFTRTIVFQMNSDGVVTHAFRPERGDSARVRALIEKVKIECGTNSSL